MPSATKSICLKILPFFLASLIFFSINKGLSAEVNWEKTTINRINLPANASVAVSAYVGGYLFDLEGLTSPWAKVEFFSTEGNIKVSTLASQDGIFHFRSVLAPVQTGDFCFLSYDVDNIANNPLCFPPPMPETKTTVSGIVLSPTISIDKSLFRQNETVLARGRVFPNANLQVFLFETQRNIWGEFFDVIIPAAFAREGPKLELKADQEGLFSFNLPTQKSTRWRFFIGPRLDNQNTTAKSNTLTFSALSWWQWLILRLLRMIYQLLRTLFNWLFHEQVIIGLLLLAIIFVTIKLRAKNEIA